MAFQLMYSSEASEDLTEATVDEIITKSRERNVTNGISGLLIYMNRCFLQLLEGEEDRVKSLYAKISADPRHVEPFLYHEQKVAKKAYGSWTQGYRQPVYDGVSLAEIDPKEASLKLRALAVNKPLWIRSALLMFGNAHCEIGALFRQIQQRH